MADDFQRLDDGQENPLVNRGHQLRCMDELET